MERQTAKKLHPKGWLSLVGVGVLTGLFAGLTVSAYTAAVEFLGEKSARIYGWLRENPAWIALLPLALAAGFFGVLGITRLSPMSRGSGIPQTEGAARGVLRFKWLRTLLGTAFGSLIAIFCGLAVGSEGPSLQIGACCGKGTAKLLRRRRYEQRYQMTGGACAGLATAFNAPLSGLVFAFEDAHRRFSPDLFAVSFSAVITAVGCRVLLIGGEVCFPGFQMAGLSWGSVGLAAAVGLLSGAGGLLFCRALLWYRGAGKSLRWLKLALPFALAGLCGLFLIEGTGTGKELVMSLSAGELAAGFLALVLVVRFVLAVLAAGAGVPGGLLIPMLALGACFGGLLARLLQPLGLSPELMQTCLVLGMTGFFAASVRTPITAVLLPLELTGCFSSALLPLILCAAIAYLLAGLTNTPPLYEALLERMVEEDRREGRPFVFRKKVEAGSAAAGRTVREVLWPGHCQVICLRREGVLLPVDGETLLLPGDELEAELSAATSDEGGELLDELLSP